MELNDIVVFDGRRYVVVGFDPMSVTPQRVYVRDVKTRQERPLLYEKLLEQVQRHSHQSPDNERRHK